MSFLGIDLGTSGLRALLVNDEGQSIGSAESKYEASHPEFGWSEQSPDQWIAALDSAFAELAAKFDEFRSVRGIGVAGHMHGATLLDASGEVLRPCILWNDTRAEKEAALLDQSPQVREISANIVFPGFTAPKLLWVKNNEPEVFEKVAKVLLPTAYLNYYLTGEPVADMSDSAGTSWLDVGKRAWSDHLLNLGAMTKDQMPRLVEGCAPAGVLRRELSERWGFSAQVIVCGGAGDNAAAACGIGVLNEGDGFVSLGTSGVVLVARDKFNPAPETALHTFCHAVPDQWYQMGVMLSATDSLNWLSLITGTSPKDLTDALGTNLQPPTTVGFLPYLSGERTPHNDAHIRGGFTGLATSTGRDDLTRAVLEGVCFGLKDSLEALKVTGVQVDILTAIGGGSASTYWVKLLSTILGVSLRIPEGREFGAALGAARLAMIAVTDAQPSDVIREPETGAIIHPNSDHLTAFEDSYARYRTAYSGLKVIQ